MAENEAKIRIRLGQIEIEYQGAATFLQKDLLQTVKELLELQDLHPIALQAQSESDGTEDSSHVGKLKHSTDTIANILGAKSGPELVMAAAAHLHFAKNKQTFTRHEIIDEMRTATGHMKDSYVANMTAYLKGLKGSKDQLRLMSKDTYALSNKAKQALGAKIAKAE